ncbi:hypothetical protein K466DRAFT_587362 [Polyporus arcularius HHB13444]|uniref:AB hydrolase-1 domain-containing protein n=1 Tax=Polyporus arcularius HHB13444 TaxID=1314778 RepID=A0A5C3PBE1_9APHY|nr:hypothetical protein K466DRAFT_587362 [Polyporus arcularius HHB13444]
MYPAMIEHSSAQHYRESLAASRFDAVFQVLRTRHKSATLCCSTKPRPADYEDVQRVQTLQCHLWASSNRRTPPAESRGLPLGRHKYTFHHVPEDTVFRVPDSGLFITANYCTPTRTEQSERAGGEVTLVLARRCAAEKEQWEDIIAKLFRAGAASDQLWRLRDAWALDPQSYGKTPVLDANASLDRKPLSTPEYAKVLRYFVTSKLIQGRSIVVIGMSESTAAWTMACAGATIPAIRAMIFIEPQMASHSASQDDEPITKDIVNLVGVLTRADSSETPSLSTLQKMLQKWHPWKIWDERIFEAHLRHGFIESRNVVTELVEIPATCPPEETGWCIVNGNVLAGPGTLASDVCARYPVHVILKHCPEGGANESLKSNYAARNGEPVVSVSITSRSRHLSVRENQEAVSDAIYRVLSSLGMNVKTARQTARL